MNEMCNVLIDIHSTSYTYGSQQVIFTKTFQYFNHSSNLDINYGWVKIQINNSYYSTYGRMMKMHRIQIENLSVMTTYLLQKLQFLWLC
jgi:hypothetical protein